MRIRSSVMGPTGKWKKLENPARVAELSPADTLTRAGISDGDAVCDIGAGSGLFATAAAGLTHAAVYAVDTDADILARLAEKARAEGLSNLHTMPVSGYSYPLEENSVDLILLVTLLHEIDRKDLLFAEIKRILKPSGRICIVEFRKGPTPMGPPVPHRCSARETEAICAGYGYRKAQEFLVGESFYSQVYTHNPE